MAAVYQNPERHLEERLDDLIGRMKLAEKIAQLAAIAVPAAADSGDTSRVSPLEELLETRLSGGAAAVVGLANAGDSSAASYRDQVAALQQQLRTETRLGIPVLVCERLPDALKAGGACVAPQPLAQAATFNPGLVQQLARAQRDLLLSLGVRLVLAPSLDVARDPRWRKLEETYGEDPYLVGRMGISCIRGLQGDSLAQGVLATAGHFLGCALAEGGRRYGAVEIGRRELREVFAEPFAAAVREAGLQSVMCADSTVDGVACCGSVGFVEELLRRELGFFGMVVAEWHGVDRLVSEHRVSAGPREAAVLALDAGIDVELPGGNCFGEPLEHALEKKLLDQGLVDRAVRRVLRQKFELGLFDTPEDGMTETSDAVDSTAYRSLIRRLSDQSLVLLKNRDVLPLQPESTVALLGPGTADEALLAAAARAQDSAARSPASILRQALEQVTLRLHYAMACTAAEDAELAVATVAQNLVGADVAVVCVDARMGATERELRLPAAQQQLLAQVIDSGIPTVVVAFGKTVFMLGDFLDAAAAVLVAWRPGEEGAGAVADVLSGSVNPSGRLPMALVRRTEQLPAHYNRRVGSSAAMDQPAYHFGHGLSYSSFEYGDPECVGTVDSHGAVELSVTITNTSELVGEEVVQLYFFDPVADVTRPRRQLLGFQRLELSPGQSGRVRFQIDVSQFAYYNRQMEYVVDPGQIELLVGASSWDIRGRCQLRVEGARRQIKQQQRLATQSSVQEAAS